MQETTEFEINIHQRTETLASAEKCGNNIPASVLKLEELKLSRHVRSRHFLVDLSPKLLLLICQMRSLAQHRGVSINASQHVQKPHTPVPRPLVKATRCVRVAAQSVDVDFDGFVDYIHTTQQQILSNAEALEGNRKSFLRDRWDRGGAAEPNAGDFLLQPE